MAMSKHSARRADSGMFLAIADRFIVRVELHKSDKLGFAVVHVNHTALDLSDSQREAIPFDIDQFDYLSRELIQRGFVKDTEDMLGISSGALTIVGFWSAEYYSRLHQKSKTI